MTLAKMLATIADTEGEKREQMKEEFLTRISGHIEEKLLMACFDAAWRGRRKYISFGRNVFPPAVLKKEGFHLEPCGSVYNYCFD